MLLFLNKLVYPCVYTLLAFQGYLRLLRLKTRKLHTCAAQMKDRNFLADCMVHEPQSQRVKGEAKGKDMMSGPGGKQVSWAVQAEANLALLHGSVLQLRDMPFPSEAPDA